MLSTPNADKAWKGMTRSLPTPEAPGQYAAANKAERTAYAVTAAWTGRAPRRHRRESMAAAARPRSEARSRRTSSNHTSGTRQSPRTPLRAMRWPNEACDPAVVGPPNEPNATSPIVS